MWLIALQKKDGGIRPIAIGYTLRRLAVKCANQHIIERRSNELSPFQVGVGVADGAEATVHAIRRLTDDLYDDNVLVKLILNALTSSMHLIPCGGTPSWIQWQTGHRKYTSLCWYLTLASQSWLLNLTPSCIEKALSNEIL